MSEPAMRQFRRRRILAAFGAALAMLGGCATKAPADAARIAAAVPAAAAAVQGPASAPGAFADNPIVYFVITDRFENGDPANDASYGRKREASPAADVGTFHGGDLKGLTNKLKQGWFKQLGVNAIWITAPYEQIHGWVVGGKAEFKHYAYHGYYALDYTVLDKNMGTPDELREMVDTAHAQGIRILFDVVMNHAGYLDIQTAMDLGLDVLWPDANKADLRTYHSFIDYNNFAFKDWWGRDWVRAGLPGYIDGGRDDLTMLLAYLPDFRTESTEFVKLPNFLRRDLPASPAAEAVPAEPSKTKDGKAAKPKAPSGPRVVLRGKPDSLAVDLPNTTVRGYLVKWLTDWVREYGIDGFRADTVKHVEPESWKALKRSGMQALADWKAKNPAKKIDDAPFWMTGEFWGVGPERQALHDAGFDSLINFEFQARVKDSATPEALYAAYAKIVAGRPDHNPLSYISSHDTELFDRAKLTHAGAALMLAPGGVQIFYGDESARPPGPVPNSDPQQATRSDMNWASIDEAMLAHWRKLGTFRARHVALARGEHKQLGSAPYAFSRIDTTSGDRVVVAMEANGPVTLPVAGVFADGERLIDAYGGGSVVVAGGTVSIDAKRYVLLERAAPLGRKPVQ